MKGLYQSFACIALGLGVSGWINGFYLNDKIDKLEDVAVHEEMILHSQILQNLARIKTLENELVELKKKIGE